MEEFRRKRLFFMKKAFCLGKDIIYGSHFQLYYFIDLPWIEPIDGG